MNNKVSILIPLFNAENWIIETISSVLEQSYQHIEIIVVDDFSTDKSYELVLDLKSDKLKLFRNLRKGACAARNYAFELSAGDYIQYLDADDLLSKDKIENQMKTVEMYGDAYVYSSKWIAFENNLEDLNYSLSPIDSSFDDVVDWFNISWQKNLSAQTGIWLTPRAIVEQSGGWNENLKVNQDGDFFFRVLLKSKGIKFVDKAFVYYRRDVKSSISLSNIPERAHDMLKSYINYEAILKLKDDYEVRKALASNYINFIYIFYPKHKDLIELAWKKINNLDVNDKWIIGGANFKLLSTCFGFKNALRIRKILKS